MNLKRLLFLLLALSFFLRNEYCCFADMKAMWATRFQMDTQKNIDRLVSDAKNHGFDTIFVQVLGRGAAFYNSDILPRAVEDFDPLSYTVEKSRSAGIKVHAWLNAYYVWSSAEPPLDRGHVVNLHPDWLMADGNSIYLDPALKQVQDHLFSVYMEVAQKYGVDGIHFDYIRYPGAGVSRAAPYSASPLLAALAGKAEFYRKYWSGEEAAGMEDLQTDDTIAEKSAYVTGLVERISRGIRSLGKNLSVSAAVIADVNDARYDKCQDWPLWLDKGIIDFAVPMAYTQRQNRMSELILQGARASAGKKIVVGFGAYLLSPESLISQIRLYQKYRGQYDSLSGISLFSYDSLKESPSYLAKIKQNVF